MVLFDCSFSGNFTDEIQDGLNNLAITEGINYHQYLQVLIATFSVISDYYTLEGSNDN